MRISGQGGEWAGERGVLRLREEIREANLLASLRMTLKESAVASLRTTLGKNLVRLGSAFVFLILWVGMAAGTTYYVSSSSGSDGNNGTSSGTAWKTVAKVNGQSFLAGDSILFKRGDVWNESLVPPSSGAAGNPITFDAYGTGAPPNLTGYYAMPSSGWVLVTGNAWKAPLPGGYSGISFCLFGSVWGQKAASASTSNLVKQWDFYIANGYLYIFSVGNPSSYYTGPIVPMALTNTALISVNSKSWLTFQHLLLNWFDQYGVYVQGTSDHLVFANMEADSMIPQGTQPLGFYVNESAPGPGDIKIFNAEAHMNYDAFRFDGSATAITMINDKGYANRDAALVDNTGAVTYSNCHFYASSLAVAGSTDVLWTSGNGPTAGMGNVPADTAPAVQAWQRYPAQVTLTVDDAGMTPGADTYYASTVLPIADAAGAQVGVAITVGYPLAQTLIGEFQGWINAGRDVTAHSMSHTYYTNLDAMEVQYTGTGSAARLSISNKTLTITVTGASDSVSYNLAQGQAQGTIGGLETALTATGHFTVSENPVCQGPYGTGCSSYTKAALLSQDLADVSSQDVKSGTYHMQLDVTRLTTDEITLSRQWMTANLTGLPATPVYVYPGGYETATMQEIAAGVPYGGARGALKENLGVKDTYASGFDVENVTSFGVNPTWQGLPAASLNQKVQALVWKEMVWGVPWGIFWHMNELQPTEVTNLIADLQGGGATIQSNTSLVNWLMTGVLGTGSDGNFYYKLPASSMTLDFRPTAASPVVDAGQNLGAAYQIDINGLNQNNYGSGWEIGAHAFAAYSSYGQPNSPAGSHFSIGGTAQAQTTAQLPRVWVNSTEMNPPGGVYDVTRTANTFAGLQQAICDWAAAPDQWWLVQVPHGTVIDTTFTGYTCTQAGSTKVNSLTLMTKIVNGGAPAKFIVFDSDTPLPLGQTVCSHGITDATATRQPPSGAIATWWTGGNNGCASDMGSMWTLEGNWNQGNYGMVIQAGPWDVTTGIGPSHYAFKDVEIRPIASSTAQVFVVNMDVDPLGTNEPTQTTNMVSHIHFVNVYGHGDATDWNGAAGGPGHNRISSMIRLERCQSCSLTYSYFDYITSTGSESHVVSHMEMPGPLKIAHNWISGGSEGYITGGVSVPDPLYYDRDIEVRQNRFTNPPTWVGVNYGGASLVIKNRLEFKACERCLVDGNIAEYQDTSGGQGGQCFTLNARNCSGGAVCDNYQAVLQDITLTNNICRHSVTGIQTAARSTYPGSNGGGMSFPLRRVNASNNLFYDVGNQGIYDVPGVVGNPYVIRPLAVGENYICLGSTVSGSNKVLTCQYGPAGLRATGISAGDMFSVTNCADATWNIPSGNYNTTRGAIAQAGTDPNGLTVYYSAPAAVSATTTGCIVGNTMGGSPNFNFIHNTVVMQTLNGKGRIYAGSNMQFYTDTGCNGAGPNYPTGITAISRDSTGTIVTALVASLTGWPASLTSGYQALVEVTGSGDFNGTFYYLGQSGGNLQWMQAGTPNETGTAGGTAAQMGECPGEMFNQNNVWKDNLLAVDVGTAANCPNTPSTGWTGWVTGGNGPQEGCATGPSNQTCSENIVDTTNSVVGYTDFPGRCAAKYMEVGGANANAIPPVTMTFPANTVCSGSTADSSCVGMKGMMNGVVFDANDADYHQYNLVASSQYKGAADDGADLGANIAGIDDALTRAAYRCGTACGPGPLPDVGGTAVPAGFFGIHYNNPATLYPPVAPLTFSTVRLWDTRTGWGDMQSGPNCTNTVTSDCNFSQLDTWLNKFGSNEKLILTISKTPVFISALASHSCSYYSGSCLPPTDINCDGTGTNATWIQYITALWNHLAANGYTGRITYIEIWNEFNITGMWDQSYINATVCPGTADAAIKILVRMAQDAQCVIQGLNCNSNGTYPKTGMEPAVKIMSPPLSYISGGNMAKMFQYGVGNYVDYVSTHGYIASSYCTAPLNATCAVPETIDAALSGLKTSMATYAVNKPIMISEVSWGATSGTTDTQYEQAFVSRYYTLAAQDGVQNIDWYSIDIGALPCNSNTMLFSNYTTGTLCPTGQAVQVIEGWLSGATFLNNSYTKTARADCAAGNIYEFPIVLASGSLGRIVYFDGIADTASCTYTVPNLGFSSYMDMTGAAYSLSGVSSIMLDNRAVLLMMGA